MATSDVKVTNWPKDEGSGSRERVALDLATIIRNAEHPYGGEPIADPRDYWLKLYAECIRTIYQMSPPTK